MDRMPLETFVCAMLGGSWDSLPDGLVAVLCCIRCVEDVRKSDTRNEVHGSNSG